MSDVTLQTQPTATDIYTAFLEHETDVSAIEAMINDGRLDPSTIVAVTGKVEGNTPGENSRGNAMNAVRSLLTGRAKLTENQVAQIPFVLSSGGVGILSPHLAIYTRTPWEGPVGEPRLVLGTALSEPILPEWVGRKRIVQEVADTVRRAADRAGIAPQEAEYVLTKNRGVSTADIQEAAARGVHIEPFDRKHATAQTTGEPPWESQWLPAPSRCLKNHPSVLTDRYTRRWPHALQAMKTTARRLCFWAIAPGPAVVCAWATRS